MTSFLTNFVTGVGSIRVLSLSLVVCFLTTSVSFARDLPNWVKKTPAANEDHQFFVGSAEVIDNNDTLAIQVAFLRALGQAIAENFSAVLKIDLKGLKPQIFVSRVKDLIRRIEFREVEWLDFYRQIKLGKNTKIWVFIQYRKAARDKEMLRLKSQASQEETITYNEAGSDPTGPIVEIASIPLGALVSVDGNAMGVSPLRILGGLEPGNHRVRIESKGVEPWEETIFLHAGETLHLERNIQGGFARLKVTSTPAAAAVFMDGHFLGITPTKELFVEADQSRTVALVHCEGQPTEQTVKLNHDDTKELPVKMTPKKALLAIQTVPPEATVLLDGKEISNGISDLNTVDAGSHIITIEKDGFNNFSSYLYLRGGEKREIANLRLTAMSDLERLDIERDIKRRFRDSRLMESPWMVGAQYSFFGKTTTSGPTANTNGFGLTGEKWFKRQFGVRIDGSLHVGGSDKTSKPIEDAFVPEFYPDVASDPNFPYQISGWGFSATIMQNLLPKDYRDTFYVAADLGMVKLNYEGLNQIVDNVMIPTDSFLLTQFRFGLGVGYELLPRNEMFGATARGGFYKYTGSGDKDGALGYRFDLGVFLRL